MYLKSYFVLSDFYCFAIRDTVRKDTASDKIPFKCTA